MSQHIGVPHRLGWLLSTDRIVHTFAHLFLFSPSPSACVLSYLSLFLCVPSFIFLLCLCRLNLRVNYTCAWMCVSVCVCVCVCVDADTALLSTTSSLCLRPITGPPSVSVSPISILNYSSLSTTTWSGTVSCCSPLPPPRAIIYTRGRLSTRNAISVQRRGSLLSG